MRSFRNRLLVLIIGLVIVTQTVTLAAVLLSTRRTVEARAASELRTGATLAENLIGFRAGQLANGVGVLAADFGFREAVASGHIPTILSAARNHAQRIGADMVLVLDTRGRVLASTATVADDAEDSLAGLLEDAAALRDQPNFRVFGAHSYQFFLAPVRTPETIAWVAMGFVADEALAARIRDLVGSDVAIVTRGASGLTRVAATLPLAAAAVSPRASEVPRIIRLGTEDYLGFARRLDVRGDSVDVILLKPLQDVLAPYRELRDAMLLIDGVALLLAGLVGAVLGRGATRPIGELVRAAQRIERGQYGTAVDVSGGEEFRSLASTFNAMQSNIAAREADISYHAYHDPLTAVANRVLAKRTLEALISAGASGPGVALLLIELRNLRDINASLGLLMGDEVLREAARRLQQNVAASETVARLGETQFLVIAPGCTAERAPLYAGQLAAVIRGGFHLAGVSLDLRLACGVCLFPAHGASADELLQRVQVALEDADETRTRVAVYRAGQDQEHRRRLALVTDLRRAIDQDQLTLVYQPKVAMASRSVRSLEALVRWTHPELGAVSPAEFVPLAESTGGSRQLTNWVLGAAIRQMGEWRRAGLELDLAVNLSAPDILDPDLSDEILRLLRRHQVDSTSLLLEITESAVMRDPQLAVRNMQWLRVAGIRFAIDDFGTGHSSLSQLSVLPVDELKIDRSFMTPADPGAVTIVTSTIELGHSMGLKVVAEGVENADAWNLLRRLGCDFAQGYLISPPLDPAKIPEFVRQANQVLPDSDSTVRQIRALEQLAGRSHSTR
ncbi:MAG: EAL domain-containing protein [Gammaproteobacteria bacterium]|nr:EAL domain-containing protein [Gammaproteobacteria bacterium]MBV8404993.1 EAL domain-containing protein [Gammaproteobacteria bacterium]